MTECLGIVFRLRSFPVEAMVKHFVLRVALSLSTRKYSLGEMELMT